VKIIPLGDRIVVKPIHQEERTSGGVLLPETARDTHTEGIIVSLGDVPRLAKGDKIIYSAFRGSEVKVAGETFIIIQEKDVLAVYREEAV
jgi:chaperonin GroES